MLSQRCTRDMPQCYDVSIHVHAFCTAKGTMTKESVGEGQDEKGFKDNAKKILDLHNFLFKPCKLLHIIVLNSKQFNMVGLFFFEDFFQFRHCFKTLPLGLL